MTNLKFKSEFTDKHEYHLTIEGTHTKSKNQAKIEQKFPVTQFYDDHGYLHIYKVKEVLEAEVQKFVNSL